MSQEKVQGRRDFVAGLARDYHAEGVIYEQLKFCEYWGYERALASHIMQSDYGIPAVSIDRQYTAGGSGQLRTREQVNKYMTSVLQEKPVDPTLVDFDDSLAWRAR